MANPADTLQRALDNYARIFLLVTEVVANPTQAAIDALLSAAEGAGVVRPKVTVGIDGRSYDWAGYQAQLGKIMSDLRTQIIFFQGPAEIRSRSGF